jgi:hypothetical protein
MRRFLNGVCDDASLGKLLKHIDAPFHAAIVKLLENCHELYTDHTANYLRIPDIPFVGTLDSFPLARKKIKTKEQYVVRAFVELFQLFFYFRTYLRLFTYFFFLDFFISTLFISEFIILRVRE